MTTEEILGLDKDEKVVLDVRRHPLGLIFIYIGGVLSVVALLIVMYLAIANKDSISIDIGPAVYAGGFGIAIVFIALITYIGGQVYKSNRLVVTNENIIQVLQFSLLNRQISQLNLANVQDVSVDQKGLIPTLLNYGSVEIETAGEAANFKFPHVENPNRIAKLIIEAHETYIENHIENRSTYRI